MQLPSKRLLLILFAWSVTMGMALLAGAFGHKYRARIRAIFRSVQSSEILLTNLYNPSVFKVAVRGEGRDGAIAAFADGLLYVNRGGGMWFVDKARTLRQLSLQVPINVQEFESDPQNAGVTSRDRFAVKDLLVQPMPAGARVLASHNQWNAERDCYTLRVSVIEATADQLSGLDSATAGSWKTLFDTQPCYPLSELPGGGSPHPTLGAGGRLVALSDSQALVSVGGFKGEIEMDGPDYYWDPSNSYGKTILIDVRTGQSRIYSVGHRNPQGLFAVSDTEIWLTEHAARGGDELNRVRDGRNYGYPLVSYGTQYEAMTWPTNPVQGRHEGFEKPIYSWVPSIGISQLLMIRQDAFPYWKGDLIVASMAAEMIYRVRIEDDRVIFVEPMMIDHRIRDLAELADGRLVLKTDDNFLVYLEPTEGASARLETLQPSARGQILAAGCRGCHTVSQDGANGIGPNLWGIVGRPVASAQSFNYSAALKAVGGRWTEESLERFLARPDSFAPGNAMQMTTRYDPRQIADLIAFLRTLR